MMNEPKICTKCHQTKDASTDFYVCLGKLRSECKSCTIKRNGRYQKKVNSWKTRYTEEDRRAYMREYYAKNKEKFAKYREELRERYPNYYPEYHQKRKELAGDDNSDQQVYN